jgi:hypothetical protein
VVVAGVLEGLTMSNIVTATSMDGFFYEVVDSAIKKRGADVSHATQQYLVGLLADYAHPGAQANATLDKPLTLLLDEARNTPDLGQRFEKMRTLGDGVLYSLGFFGEHFEARGVDASYLVALGASAYQGAGNVLATTSTRDLSVLDIFGELAEKFAAFVGVITEIAHGTIASSTNTAQGLLRAYETWVRTGSDALAKPLAESGLLGAKPTTGILC